MLPCRDLCYSGCNGLALWYLYSNIMRNIQEMMAVLPRIVWRLPWCEA
jgi:hypothetical protein